jgi:RHS repeat-associated protein
MKKLFFLLVTMAWVSSCFAADIAEAQTPEIQSLAQGLGNDPSRIYQYVRDNIHPVFYFGSKKGAQLTLIEKSGNDFDQCALLVSLLRAAGYSPTYRFGGMKVPYEAVDSRDMRRWLGLSLPNTNWTATTDLMGRYFGGRGFPIAYQVTSDHSFVFHRVWVKLPIGGTNYYLDPGFKISEPIKTLTLSTAMGLSTSDLLTAAGGTVTATYVQNLNESSLRNKLRDYTSNLLATLNIDTNANKSVLEILGGYQTIPYGLGALSQTLTFPEHSALPSTDWTSIPTNMMATFAIGFGSVSNRWYLPELQGRRLSMRFDGSGLAQLWMSDTKVAETSTSGASGVDVNIKIDHPYGDWDAANYKVIDTGFADHTSTSAYQRTNSLYSIFYGFDAVPSAVRRHEVQLDSYRQANFADNSPEVVTATLQVLGAKWFLQRTLMMRMLAAQGDINFTFDHGFGRVGQESGKGYFIDANILRSSHLPRSGFSAGDQDRRAKVFEAGGFFGSALEHAIIEQTQGTGSGAASTTKMLQVASATGLKIYLATSNNWNTIRPSLVNYDTNFWTVNYINQNYTLLMPEDGMRYVTGTSGWRGFGVFARQVQPGASFYQVRSLIAGIYNGGYSGESGATVNPDGVSSQNAKQPNSFNPISKTTVGDPVNIADGSFRFEVADLSLGGPAPRGLELTRYYSSTRKNHDPATMAPGWTHNYHLNLAEVSAPEAGLGESTPAQMAPMLVATCAALNLYNNVSPEPKNWMVTALIAKWGVDQLIKNGVSVTLGQDTIQFVKQPDGTFTPPANSSFTLSKPGGLYALQQRHGNVFGFDSGGKLISITDPYNQAMQLRYDANSRLTNVTDWVNRSLTFTYSGTPVRLTSVADSTGRAVTYRYSTNYHIRGDLIAALDVEQKTNSFAYDTNHQMTATIDTLNQLVTTNIYDSFGRVVTQYSQGNTNKLWRFLYTGYENSVIDPQSGVTRYHFDEKTRQVGMTDALGNKRHIKYDGQDHVSMTISPMNETNQFQYDNRHNLTYSVDPLLKTNFFYYDTQDRLYRTVDPRGYTNHFGFNAQHSLIAVTNAMGDWTTDAYNANGTLFTRTDPVGTTTFGYDIYNQLHTITHPTTPATTEKFVRNARGDVITNINARTFPTQFEYDNRRALKKTIGPTNLIAEVKYDYVGNVQSTTDPRLNVVSNFWSSTRKLIGTVMPSTPQGIPAITNVYDSRDWLQQVKNPLLKATTYVPDAAGRTIAVSDPLLRTNFFGYDANGRRTASTNAAQEFTREIWSKRGELLSWIDATNKFVLRQYDDAGNQIVLTNRNQKKWQFQYDAAGRLTNTVTPLSRTTGQSFNNRGLLQSVRENSGDTASFTYDSKARLTNRTDTVGTKSYTYDANNNLLNITEGSQSVSWTYDAYDRVLTYTDADGNPLGYRYDANGNLTRLIYPDGRSVLYAYDSLNRVTNVTDWASRQTSLEYDLNSRLKKIIRPNGTIRELSYDDAGQTTNIVERTSSGTALNWTALKWNNAGRVEYEFVAPQPRPHTPPSRTILVDDDNRISSINGLTVNYDLDGNMTNGPSGPDVFRTYGFDARNRLRQVTSPATIGSAAFAYPATTTYYSWFGPNNSYGPVNIKGTGGTPLVSSIVPGILRSNFTGWVGLKFTVGARNWTVSELSRYVVYGNSRPHTVKLVTASGTDVAGGSVTINTLGVPANQFAYAPLAAPITLTANTTYFVVSYEEDNGDTWHDGDTQMFAAATWGYRYDPNENRIAVTNGTSVIRHVVNPNAPLSQVLRRTLPDGSKTYYIHGAGLLYEINETGSGVETGTRTYHYDYRGSTVAITDDSGTVTDRIEYSAYGTITHRSGITDTPFLFNGRYGVQSDGNGLLYMRARYYNPYLCRFINADPAGFAGGLNFYAYADGNPVSLIDPFGLGAMGEGEGRSWLSRVGQGLKGVGLTVAGFVPWLGDAIEAYTVVSPNSSTSDRVVSGGSLAVNAWTGGLAPNVGPIKKGIQTVVDAFRGGPAAGADEMVTVYRGVSGQHPQFQNAIQGNASPWGGHSNPVLHNAGDNRSEFTSWTTDYGTAVDFALQDGAGGVVLRQTVPQSTLIPSPDIFRESEVLRLGPIGGATPIILNP